MKLSKTLVAIGVASATMQMSSCQQAQKENPLLVESGLPFGAPDFNKIQTSDYLPAFELAIQQQRDNIAKIVESKDSATFENTILVLRPSRIPSWRLRRVDGCSTVSLVCSLP